VVVYANTSAAVKARADWVVTSSCALEIVESLMDNGETIIWGPDKHLGTYIQRQTGADMLLWDGACIVHEEFKSKQLEDMKALYPDAAILVHPESPTSVIELADAVGSTSQLIAAAQRLPNKTLIVATDRGIFYKMQQLCPDKVFIEAPTAGNGAACRSCAHCPWMAMNTLERTLKSLKEGERDLCRSGADSTGDPPAEAHAGFHPGGADEAGGQRLSSISGKKCGSEPARDGGCQHAWLIRHREQARSHSGIRCEFIWTSSESAPPGIGIDVMPAAFLLVEQRPEKPSPAHSHDAIDTTKRSSACHRLIALPSAFCTNPHTCMPRVCPPGPELGEEAEQHQQQHRRHSGSPSSAPDSVSARRRSSPMIAAWIIL
jgi:hypothetical protein